MATYTLAQRIETYMAVTRDTPDLCVSVEHMSEAIVDIVNTHQSEQAGIEQVTPVEGSMSSSEHTAFILRIFMYLVAVQPNKVLTVDLERVKALTGDHTLDVKLEGATFTAKATQHRLNDRGLLI